MGKKNKKKAGDAGEAAPEETKAEAQPEATVAPKAAAQIQPEEAKV